MMTPRAYETACRLAKDPSTSEHERDTARRRVADYEAKHGKPQPVPGRMPWAYSSSGGEHDSRDLCATCGKDWAIHWIAQTIDDIRPEMRPCGAFVPKMKPPRRKPRFSVEPVPWWTLAVSMAGGKRLGLTYAFRCALRELRAEDEQPRERAPRGIYAAPPETIEHIERGEVAWRWFPDWKDERDGGRGSPWRPPPEMRAAMKAQKGSR